MNDEADLYFRTNKENGWDLGGIVSVLCCE